MTAMQTSSVQPVSVPAGPADPVAPLDAAELAPLLADQLARVVRGKPEAIRLSLVALLSGGHLLLEDVPGVGKTLLAKALARSIGGTFRRVQGTPDLLPSELTGASVLDASRQGWEFRPGPLFANVVLVDEVNRATPRTQSALLEAMEERQVTVDGITYSLPTPFFLVATQNPFEHVGTFPLVEGQRDRFAVVVEMGHPDATTERELLLGHGGDDALARIGPVTDAHGLAHAIRSVRSVHCEPAVADYVVALAEGTRVDPGITIGASPRASLALLQAARAAAVLAQRSFVTPDDVKSVAAPVLAHRLIPLDGPDLGAATAIVARLLDSVVVPPR
jgi:MoxR-like ATPase